MRKKYGILFVTFALMPSLAFAQSDGAAPSFSREGVFGCSQTGSYSMSVGALSAVGGAFVPVNDAAVTLNTGYLVYKECVLRGIVDRMRENATANLQRQIQTTYLRGRSGQPLFSQSFPLESRAVYNKSVLNSLNSNTLNTVSPTFQASVKRAILQGYMTSLNAPNKAFACSYTGDLRTLQRSPTRFNGNIWTGLDALSDTDCIPFFAYMDADDKIMGDAASTWNDTLTRLQLDNGNYPIMGTDANGNPIVLTPGSIVGANALQALQTGFTQLQNANDIDQMVGALFAGITSQVIGDSRGLVGLTKGAGGQPSYLDRVVEQSAQGLRNSAINAGIQILVAQQQIETRILQFAKLIVDKIKAVSLALQAKENGCWTLVVKAVCTDTLKSDNTCTSASACTKDPQTGETTCTEGPKLKVATSTYQFAQRVVDSQVTPYRRIHENLASTTQETLTKIGQLIAQLTDTSSYTAQLAALQAFDRLASQGVAFHRPQDVTNEQSAHDTLVGQNGGAGSLDQLVTDTVKAWADGAPSGQAFDGANNSTGWCNVQNQTTVSTWVQAWKQ